MAEEVVPVLRVADTSEAAAWYARLGFSVGFEHRFAPGLPLFVGIERGTMHLYLSEHSGDATPDTLFHLWVDDVDAIAEVFEVDVEILPWGHMIDLTDPDGNRLRVGSRVDTPADTVEAVVITGPYGAGKSTMAAQIADLIEPAGVRYGAIDLDWLGWYDDQAPREDGDWSMLLRNVSSVVANYRAAGVDRFVVALSLESEDDVALLADAMGMPVRTVELTVPIEEIERRLSADPTTGRRKDLEEARRWVAGSIGTGFADLVVANDRPATLVADEIIAWLGWVG